MTISRKRKSLIGAGALLYSGGLATSLNSSVFIQRDSPELVEYYNVKNSRYETAREFNKIFDRPLTVEDLVTSEEMRDKYDELSLKLTELAEREQELKENPSVRSAEKKKTIINYGGILATIGGLGMSCSGVLGRKRK